MCYTPMPILRGEKRNPAIVAYHDLILYLSHRCLVPSLCASFTYLQYKYCVTVLPYCLQYANKECVTY